MAFVKLYKNKSYFIRFQTKYRRRREGKTDYYARKRLITQDKDKFNTPKYRLVGRFTNTKATAQIVSATIKGDIVICQASSTQLKKFGLTTGFASYSAGYATGLLLARRLLKQYGMDQAFKGVDKTTGEDYDVTQVQSERRPFKCVLDVGLRPTTTGNKIFSILKGAIDGGLHVPHGIKRFPGYTSQQGKKINTQFHRQRILGGHIDGFMEKLKSNKDKFHKQFSLWQKCLQETKQPSVAKLFEKIHADIRKDPTFTKKAAKVNPKREHAKKRCRKIKAEQFHKRVAKRIQIFMKKELKQKK